MKTKTLEYVIRRINDALTSLGQRRAYDIKWPTYNKWGYCFERIVSGATALGLQQPEDVPCWPVVSSQVFLSWDFWLERYIPGEFFWKLWEWQMNREGNPPEDLYELLDFELHVNGAVGRTVTTTVLGQVTALTKLRGKYENSH